MTLDTTAGTSLCFAFTAAAQLTTDKLDAAVEQK